MKSAFPGTAGARERLHENIVQHVRKKSRSAPGGIWKRLGSSGGDSGCPQGGSPGIIRETHFLKGRNAMLTVVAVMNAKEGKEKEMQEAIEALVDKVRSEEGTLMYAANRGRKAPGRFLFYEKYRDKDAFKAHGATAYFGEFFGKVAPLLDGEPSIEIYEEFASIPPKG
jgi:quinol monooxygenase YgiN